MILARALENFLLFTEIPTEKLIQIRVGSKKSESREVGWLIGAKSGSEGPVPTYDVCSTLGLRLDGLAGKEPSCEAHEGRGAGDGQR